MGDNNPAGRLPVTFYKSVSDLPPFENYAMTGRTYRYFTGKPLYGFGYGLSYSTFKYSNMRLSKSTVKAGGTLTVEAEVKNVSPVAGDEVVQLYLVFPAAANLPRRALQGFVRVRLQPGEARHLKFDLSPAQLSAVTSDGRREMIPGDYSVLVGGGQPEDGAPRVEQKFRIEAASKK